jgi:MFS superfamily sulfate permease-like transporter
MVAVSIILVIFGLVFIAIALVYWMTPAGGLPRFLPGFEAGSDHVHLTHALGSLLVALALFAIAIVWFELRSED